MKNIKKLIVFILVIAVSLQVNIVSNNTTVKAVDYGVYNPRIQNGVSTWDCVYFGSYPQTSAGGNSFKVEPIKWRVLTVDGNNAFLMADKALDCKPYHTTQTAITWKDCSLRTWLNNSFYNEAFNSTEKAAIYTTNVKNDDNPFFGTEGGEDTSDKVYTLSIDEARSSIYGFDPEFWETTNTRGCVATDYAISKGCSPYDAYYVKDVIYLNHCYWWLRSPGQFDDWMADVADDGFGAYDGGVQPDSSTHGVRPVLRLNLSNNCWTKAGSVNSNDEERVTPTKKGSADISKSTPSLSKPSIKSVKSKKKALKITWKKDSSVNGYKLQYSIKKSFKGAKTITIKKASTTSKTIKKLKRKKKYYIRIKTYKVVSGKTHESEWSKVKTKKTK